MKRVLVISLLLTGVLTGIAVASPCHPYEEQIAHEDVVVEGRAIWFPIPQVVVVEVTRYYKGSGPRLLVADLPGLRGYYLWKAYWAPGAMEPQTPWIFGFRPGWGIQLTTGNCDLWGPQTNDVLRETVRGLGEGKSPTDGLAMRSHWAIGVPLFLVTLVVTLRQWRRSRLARRVR